MSLLSNSAFKDSKQHAPPLPVCNGNRCRSMQCDEEKTKYEAACCVFLSSAHPRFGNKKNQCIPETQANTLYSVQTKQTLSQMLVNVFTLITAYSQRCLSTCVMFIQVDGVHYELRLQYSFRCGDMCKIKWNNPSFITLPYNL